MSVEQIEEQVRRLPPRELAHFVLWLESFLGLTFPGGEMSDDELEDISEKEKSEILRRRAEILGDPSLSKPMDDEYFERLKSELADARAERAPGR